MYVGLDSIPLAGPKTGIGHYTFELARGLALVAPEDEFELVSPFRVESAHNGGTEAKLPDNLQIVHALAGGLKQRWWTIGLPLYVRRMAFDLFHGTNYSVPLWNRCPTVLTIHDLTLYLYPETFQQHVLHRARRRLPIMARTATRIITPSEQVRREVCEHLEVKPEKVVAIPEAARHSFYRVNAEQTIEARRRLGVEDEFILFVGTIEPRKNLLTLVRAFEQIIRETALRPQLVIAGGHGWQADEFYSHIKRSGIGDRIHFTGYVKDDELRALYSSCRVCVYPSLYEGFGLPPLEAMSCGAPVVTSRIPCIMETVGTAARTVVPTDVHALAQAIIEMLRDENMRRHFSDAGLKRAAAFTWEQTAHATLDVYRAVLGVNGNRRTPKRQQQRNIPVRRIYEPDISTVTLARRAADKAEQKNSDDEPERFSAALSSHNPVAPSANVSSDDRETKFEPRADDRYHVNDLVSFEDEEFVRNAYRAILKRVPDAAGFDFYLKSLRTANLDKIEILAKLRFSPEGRAKRVHVEGLRLPALMRSASNLPLVGRFVRLVLLPSRVSAQYQQLTYQITRQGEELDKQREELNRRSEEFKRQAADIADALETTQAGTAKALATFSESLKANDASAAEALRCVAEASQTLTAQQRQVNRLRTDLEKARDEMRARIIEFGKRIRALSGETTSLHPSPNIASAEHNTQEDALYAAFTDAFRGSHEDVKRRLRIYLPIIKQAQIGTEEMPILDLGAGRGEWLEVLKEENLAGYGVDINRIFVERCRERDLDVTEDDLIAHLRSLPDASVGAVTAFHVVEHLPAETLITLLDETVRVLKPGGAVIFETPNPQNINAGSYAFHLDLTHHKPLPVPTLQFLFEWKNLERIEIIGLHEAPDKLTEESDIADRLNFFFYGSMDYAITGWKPLR
jgi:glycosyltransferase involved in cell wall biosynthesis/SAM-dependent methyltransferase